MKGIACPAKKRIDAKYNKITIVTGSNSGIGLGIDTGLVKTGCEVVMSGLGG